MRNARVIALLLLVTLFVLSSCTKAPQDGLSSSADYYNKQGSGISQLDKLVARIHDDLMDLSEHYEWLSAYDDKCLSENRSIFYMQIITEQGSVSQQPNHMYIGYKPIGETKGFKYWNDVEAESACRFPSLGLKLYVHILLTGKKGEILKKEIRRHIIERCKERQEQIK